MAATTITRASLTDGVSVWNAALVGTSIYDKIDSLIAANITFGGRVSAEGFGTHNFSAGGTGGNVLAVRNTTAGTGNYTEIQIGNDASAAVTRLFAFSSTYTTASYWVQDSTVLQGSRVGGISVVASDASGEIRFYTGGGTKRADIGSTGILSTYGGLALAGSYDQTIVGTQEADPSSLFYGVIRLTSCTSTPKISRLAAGSDGNVVVIINLSGASCSLQHNEGTATKKMYLSNAVDGTLSDKEAIMLVYDAGATAWVQVGPQ